MSFDQRKVGLPELYGQTRVKTIDNLATANGATLRGDGAVPIVANAATGFRVRVQTRNGGEEGGQLVRIGYFAPLNTNVIANVVPAVGTVYGMAEGAGVVGTSGGYVDVLPGADGDVDVTITLGAVSAGINVFVTCGADMIVAPGLVIT